MRWRKSDRSSICCPLRAPIRQSSFCRCTALPVLNCFPPQPVSSKASLACSPCSWYWPSCTPCAWPSKAWCWRRSSGSRRCCAPLAFRTAPCGLRGSRKTLRCSQFPVHLFASCWRSVGMSHLVRSSQTQSMWGNGCSGLFLVTMFWKILCINFTNEDVLAIWKCELLEAKRQNDKRQATDSSCFVFRYLLLFSITTNQPAINKIIMPDSSNRLYLINCACREKCNLIKFKSSTSHLPFIYRNCITSSVFCS